MPVSASHRAQVALIVCLGVLALLLTAGALPVPLTTAAPAPPGQPARALPVQVVLDAVDPAVIGPGVPWQITGTVRNVGTDPVPVAQVRASTAYLGLDTRPALDSWATGEAGLATTREVGADALDTWLAPGATTSFLITVPADQVDPPFGFATLPLTIEVVGEQQLRGQVRTFLPWYAVESPDPTLSLSWVVPLTLPPSPGLTATDPQVRAQAWLEAIGPDSPVSTWLEVLAGHRATYLVDPALLAPVLPPGEIARPADPGEEPGDDPGDEPGDGGTEEPTAPPTSPSPTSPSPTSPSPTSAPPTADRTTDPATGDPATSTEAPTDPPEATEAPTDPPPSDPPAPATPTLPGVELPEVLTAVQQASVDLQNALAGLGHERLWWLPVHDPDLSAFISLGTPAALVRDQLQAALPEATLLAPQLLQQGRHDVTWPAWDRVRTSALADLTTFWPDQQPLGAVVVPDVSVAVPQDDAVGTLTLPPSTGAAAGEELTLLRYDTVISGTIAQPPAPEGTAPVGVGETTQRVVAETLAVHQQLGPAVERSIVIAPPRGTRVEEARLAAVVQALDAAPWLRHVPAADLLDEAPEAELTDTPLTDDALTDDAAGGPTAYPLPAPSPLNPALVEDIETLRDTTRELATILPSTEGVRRWDYLLDGSYSTRWRQDPRALEEPLAELRGQVDAVLSGVQVNDTQVNFLADEGLIRMTVVNSLPIGVRDLTLHLEPGNGRLRIVEQPEDITIGPESRATVTFRARAVASGEVPVTAYLTTPTGLQIGAEQVLEVQVQPTGTWIYWVLGGAAGVILVLGLGRALRRPPRLAGAATSGHPASVEANEEDR